MKVENMKPKLTLKTWLGLAFIAAVIFTQIIPARAQTTVPNQLIVPLGYCQLTAAQLPTAVGLTSCIRASFTGTGSGTNLTVSAVTGIIKAGDNVTGTGVPAGTKILSQTSDTAGGAGVYVTSNATTSSGASLTSGGIPTNATMAYLTAATAAVSYRDDGGVPTASVGISIPAGGGIFYAGTLSTLQFISATGILNVAFYR
jgi:hypothetical protein